jgi:hypothetical protein
LLPKQIGPSNDNEQSQEVGSTQAKPPDPDGDRSSMSEDEVKLSLAQKKIKRSQPTTVTKVYTMRELPLDLWMTRVICLCLTAAWTALLIAAAVLEENAWYLLAVGAIGMAQNAIVAGVCRGPEKRGIHLKSIHVEKKGKVMDVLMNIESAYPGKNIGRSLRDEFFPGKLEDIEVDWWDGNKEAYDNVRLNDEDMDRGMPWD